MINPVDRLSWQEMLGHPASAGHLVDTQVNTAYNKMAVLSDHIEEFKDLYDFIFRIKGWLRYYLQANYGLEDFSDIGLNNDTNGHSGSIDLIDPATGEVKTKKVWRIYIKNYDEIIKASEAGTTIPNPIVRFANIYDPLNPVYLDLEYKNGKPTFSGTFNPNDTNSYIPLRYLNEQIAILRKELKIVSVDRSISTTTDSQGRANKRLVVNDVINFSNGSHINVSGAADVPFMTKGSKVNISGDATGSGTVDDNGNINISIDANGVKDYYANSNKNISTTILGSGNNSMTIKDTYYRKNGQNVINNQTVSLPFATYQEMVDYVNGHKGSDIGSAPIVAAYWSDTDTISGTDVVKRGEAGKVYPASQLWLNFDTSGTTTTLRDHPADGNYRCLSTSYAKNSSGENSTTTATGSAGDRWFVFDGTLGTFMKVS